MSDVINLPMSVTFKGRRWNLFTYDYKTPDGTFSGYLYAISAEHAAALLSELKETAELKGQMVGVTK